MSVKRLQNAYYVVGDIDRARAFYEQSFGLKLKFQDGAKWAQFDAGGTNFSLSSPEEAAKGARGGVVVFEVDDIVATAQQVLASGGRVLAERDMGGHGKSTTVADPDGNILQLFQRAAKPG